MTASAELTTWLLYVFSTPTSLDGSSGLSSGALPFRISPLKVGVFLPSVQFED
jgi:hypothetical protein